MEGSSSSISSKSHDSDIQAGLAIISAIDSCPVFVDFDLILRSFGSTCNRCEGGEAQMVTLSTKSGPGLVDPRNLQRLAIKIDEYMDKGNLSKVCICGVEALFLWNGSEQVRKFLIGIDEDFKRRGARAFLALREDAFPIEDLRIMRDILSR
jgi:hypothetical protein